MTIASFNPAAFSGHLLALATAALWAISPMFMASAGRRVGSFPVLLLRSIVATVLLSGIVGVMAAISSVPVVFPTLEQTGWIALSGVAGVGVGDILIYEAFVVLGPRRTTQTLVLAPAVTVLIAWIILNETLNAINLAGVAVILGGTSYAVFAGNRRPAPQAEELVAAGESGDVETATPNPPRRGQEPGRVTAWAFLLAVGGAVCMAIGAVLVRYAFQVGTKPDALPATLVRVGAATAFLWIMPLLRGQARSTLVLLKDGWLMRRVGAGILMGPILGMLCYVAAFKQLPAGLVSTLVATSPLFAIPLTVLRYGVRIGFDVVLAACVATAGVAMLFYN